MSTVQTVYDFIQYRPDIQVTADDLIHIVNGAIRAISRRLYSLNSDLVTARMEVPIYGEVSYTASMAFVDSNPDTITDAAVQFVVEGFEANMPITTDHASNAGPFRINTVAAGTLTLVSTDSVVAAGASSFTITSDDEYGFLPSDFWGLRDKPYLSGKTYPLLALPSQEISLSYTGAGEPLYYKIIGTKVYVTPHTASDYTIKGDYFQRPTSVSTTASTLPYNELFDEIIAEYVIRYFRGKENQKGQAEALLSKDLQQEVDLIAGRYDRKAPVQFQQAVDWTLN